MRDLSLIELGMWITLFFWNLQDYMIEKKEKRKVEFIYGRTKETDRNTNIPC